MRISKREKKLKHYNEEIHNEMKAREIKKKQSVRKKVK
jgi:hypothetical protein